VRQPSNRPSVPVRPCVLVVDDSESVRKRVTQVLRMAGVEADVIAASGGAEALAIMAAQPVALVLCDVEMPGLDGFNFLKITRGHADLAEIPVIMLTVKEDLGAKVKGLTEGASDYLTKPFHNEELVARVRVHLKLKQLQDELRLKNARLEELSRLDALTQLSNRRHFMEVLESEFARATRYSVALSLVMLDVDLFKAVNDTWGHVAGDDALVGVATAAKSLLRKSDHAARYGGEEFALLLPETPMDGALVVAERVRRAVSEVCLTQPAGTFSVTVSLGVATFPGPGILNPSALVQRADEALYAAKRAGRNRVHAAEG
jgi:two-component system, cell cycle response regulator